MAWTSTPPATDHSALLARIVAAYEAFTAAEIGYGRTKPDVVETARNALRDCIVEARRVIGAKPRR